MEPCSWKPKLDDCLSEAIQIAFSALGGLEGTTAPSDGSYIGPSNQKADYDTMKKIADLLSAYLGRDVTAETLEDVIKVIDAFCQILVQRVTVKRQLNKAGMTINDCDL